MLQILMFNFERLFIKSLFCCQLKIDIHLILVYNSFMIEKNERIKILEKYNIKEDKILVANILDLINKFYIYDYVLNSKFLNIYEKNIAIDVLNYFNVKYRIFSDNENIERNVIFLIPEYIENVREEIDKKIKVLKIIPKCKNKLLHKDYMGAIYSLGIDQKNIGDIFNINDYGYVFLFSENIIYFENNLLFVSNTEVKLNILSIYDQEIVNLKNNYNEIIINVRSLRIDLILSEIYKLSRNESKEKIENGDLFINSVNMYFPAYEIKENDIISFKKCGKIRISNFLGNTKSGNYKVKVKIYN